jgi:arginine-tRNA-protein transferase
MSLDFEFPHFLSRQDLDALLARGWFRMRENVFTTHYYLRDCRLLSTVWLRSPLDGYRFSKSQRKHLRYLHQRYEIAFMNCALTEEHEVLYQEYLKVAEGERSSSLRGVLGEDTADIFHSKMLEVRDPEQNNRLIAMSIFDEGLCALQSIVGIYHPEYGHESLGVYTMLLEVEQAIQTGFSHYYIGYFTPGFATFDYKLRLQNLEYFNPDDELWRPLADLDRKTLWSSQHIDRLTEMKVVLDAMGIHTRMRLNVHYDTIILHALGDVYVDEPLVLDMRLDTNQRIGHLCYFAIHQQRYKLVLADYESRTSNREAKEPTTDEGFPEHQSLIRKTHLIAESESIADLLMAIWGEET